MSKTVHKKVSSVQWQHFFSTAKPLEITYWNSLFHITYIYLSPYHIIQTFNDLEKQAVFVKH